MEKSKLYSRTGDAGTTSLVGGERVSKTCVRLEAYGTVDEFSCFLGVVLSSPDCPEELRAYLTGIQNRLFDIGGYLACTPGENAMIPVPAWLPADIEAMEKEIDRLDSWTPKVNAFVLPGGSMLAAHTHVARAVCRRAERRILTLAAESEVDPNVIKYFNRLSDYLFILARHLNHKAGIPEIIWQYRP